MGYSPAQEAVAAVRGGEGALVGGPQTVGHVLTLRRGLPSVGLSSAVSGPCCDR